MVGTVWIVENTARRAELTYEQLDDLTQVKSYLGRIIVCRLFAQSFNV